MNNWLSKTQIIARFENLDVWLITHNGKPRIMNKEELIKFNKERIGKFTRISYHCYYAFILFVLGMLSLDIHMEYILRVGVILGSLNIISIWCKFCNNECKWRNATK